MVPNSIAIQTGDDPQSAAVDFFPDGGSAPFLKPEGGLGWFWPYHALRTPEGLYLFLLHLEHADIPPPFGFKLVSAWLGHVRNPDEPPPEWVLSLQKIPWVNARRNFGSFLLVKDGYVYIYGTAADTEKGRMSWDMILARAPAGRLADFNSWLFYREGGWVAEIDRAERICGDVASEFSVSFQPKLNRYVLLYTARAFSGHSNSSVMRLSPGLHGPWSDPIEVNRCPEAKQDPGICCYAAKGHPEMASSPEELIFTYIANSCHGDLKVLTDAGLYRPRFLRIRFADPGK
jgi:hypothetical protein